MHFLASRDRCGLSVAAICLLAASCLPVAPIQSARVSSTLSKGARLADTYYEYHPARNDSAQSISPTRGRPELSMTPFLSVGIARRVEISLLLVPLVPLQILYVNPGLKVNVLDIGTPRLFRNLGLALYAGGDLGSFEWEDMSDVWGGVIVGTHSEALGRDLELVCMVAGAYDTMAQTSGDGCTLYGRRTGIDISTGVIVTPGRQKWLELNAGVTYRYACSRHLSIYGNPLYGSLGQWDCPWVLQGVVKFNFVRPQGKTESQDFAD